VSVACSFGLCTSLVATVRWWLPVPGTKLGLRSWPSCQLAVLTMQQTENSPTHPHTQAKWVMCYTHDTYDSSPHCRQLSWTLPLLQVHQRPPGTCSATCVGWQPRLVLCWCCSCRHPCLTMRPCWWLHPCLSSLAGSLLRSFAPASAAAAQSLACGAATACIHPAVWRHLQQQGRPSNRARANLSITAAGLTRQQSTCKPQHHFSRLETLLNMAGSRHC
jgi:hypothetical protein